VCPPGSEVYEHRVLYPSCDLRNAAYHYRPRMKKVAALLFIIAAGNLVLSGCASPGPDPEQVSREAEKQREAERQQAEFRKGLPPVTNPSQVR